jgi:hypothetical protein
MIPTLMHKKPLVNPLQRIRLPAVEPVSARFTRVELGFVPDSRPR